MGLEAGRSRPSPKPQVPSPKPCRTTPTTPSRCAPSLARPCSRDLLKQLHVKTPLRHFAVAIRQFAILGVATWGLIRFEHPAIWIPLAVVQGFTVFNFTVLLHEVLHRLVFERSATDSRTCCSAWPTPFRAALPRRSSPGGIWITMPSWARRWAIRSAITCRRSETSDGSSCFTQRRRFSRSTFAPPLARRAPIQRELQRLIRRERLASIGAHLSVLALIWWGFGGWAALRAYVVPVFFVFPIAFTLNRLGQHYDIDPADPARWSTLMRGQLVLGLPVSQLQLPSGASLLSGRALLSPAATAARAGPVLRAPSHAVANAIRSW